VREGAEGEIGQPAQPFGEQAQGDGLAGAGGRRYQGEAALADEALLDARAEEPTFGVTQRASSGSSTAKGPTSGHR
jgi:hypothetical protein